MTNTELLTQSDIFRRAGLAYGLGVSLIEELGVKPTGVIGPAYVYPADLVDKLKLAAEARRARQHARIRIVEAEADALAAETTIEYLAGRVQPLSISPITGKEIV